MRFQNETPGYVRSDDDPPDPGNQCSRTPGPAIARTADTDCGGDLTKATTEDVLGVHQNLMPTAGYASRTVMKKTHALIEETSIEIFMKLLSTCLIIILLLISCASNESQPKPGPGDRLHRVRRSTPAPSPSPSNSRPRVR